VFTRRILVCCSLPEVRRCVSASLADWQVEFGADLDPSLKGLRLDAAILECSGREHDPGLVLARKIRNLNQHARIVIIAPSGSEDLAIEALRVRAVEYLKPPIDGATLICAVCGTEATSASGPALARGIASATASDAIVGESSAILGVKRFLTKVASCDTNVLITGETGTGKEMIAEQIHSLGSRARKPFVSVNCSAIPETLIESELFGYERGAFTGAVGTRDGKLAQADKGTLFFDEIGDMSPLAQAKILRAIESREFTRLGGNRSIRVDVRLIAATNRDLESLLREDRFRTDLFFRLNVARIELPSLRERSSDIPLLIQHFVRHYNRVFGAAVERISGEALEQILVYPFPGNIRELKNVVEVIFLNLAPGQKVVQRLPDQVLTTWRKITTLPQDERDRLVKALLQTEWNVSAAARKLEWSRMTLYRKLAKYNIQPERGPLTASKVQAS
jgi:DNA-binding NtrC family response regulator